MHKSKVVSEGRRLWGALVGHPVLPYEPDAILKVAGVEEDGFTGTCETTLTDWIQMIQMGRRDAIVTLRTYDGKQGTLWCRGGDVIDASCEGLTGKAAVYRALTWRGGRVSVDFAGFSHRRGIDTASAGLLLGLAYKRACRDEDHEQLEGFTAGTTTKMAAVIAIPEAPAESAVSARAANRRPKVLLMAFVGTSLLVGLVVIVAVEWRASTHSTGALAGITAQTILVGIQTDPAHAAIVLDGKPVGVGTVALSLPRDGRTHEILYFAPGYVSQRAAFRDTPPRSVVTLLRSTSGAPARKVSGPDIEPFRTLLPPRSIPSEVVRTRTRVSRTLAPRAGANVPDLAGGQRKAAVPAVADVQIIDERSPRVQIIESGNPRIDVIE